MFISTYLFVTRASSDQNNSHLLRLWIFYHHSFVNILLLLWPSTVDYGDRPPSTSRTQYGLASEPFPPPNTTRVLVSWGRKCKSWFCCRDSSDKRRH